MQMPYLALVLEVQVILPAIAGGERKPAAHGYAAILGKYTRDLVTANYTYAAFRRSSGHPAKSPLRPVFPFGRRWRLFCDHKPGTVLLFLF